MLSNCGAGENSWVPWRARSSNQSILKDINPEYSLEGLMLKLQYFVWRASSLENTPIDAEKNWEQEEKGTSTLSIHWKDWCQNSNTMCGEPAHWKTPQLMLGKTESRKRKGATKIEMFGWHHWLSEQEFEQTPGYSEGQTGKAGTL